MLKTLVKNIVIWWEAETALLLPCSQHKPTAMELKTAHSLTCQHMKHQLCKTEAGFFFFFAVFIVQLTATNICITHSHLDFLTMHFKFCICIHFMNFITNKMQAELCVYFIAEAFPSPAHSHHLLSLLNCFCHFLAVTLSSLFAKYCNVVSTVACQ